MKLTVYDREVASPSTRVRTSRDLNIGLVTPEKTSELGRTLEQMGAEIAGKVKVAEETAEYSSAVARAKQHMSRYYAERALDAKNYKTLRDDVNKEFNRVSNELLDNIDGKIQFQRVQKGLSQIGLTYDQQAVSDSLEMKVNHIKAAMLNTRAYMVEEASTDSESFSKNFQEYSEILWNYARAGVYEYDDAQKDLIDFASDAVRGRVRNLQNNDLDAALEFLTDSKSDARLIDKEARERLIASTSRMIETRDRRIEAERRAAERAEEKVLKQIRDNNYNMQLMNIVHNDHDVAHIEMLNRAGLLHKGDFDKLYKASLNRTKEWTGNDEMYNTMKSSMYVGELSTSDVLASVNDEQINWTMAEDLITGIEKGASITNTEDYKMYYRSLMTSLGWSPTMAGMSNPEQSQLASKAQLEFYLRAANGEDLSVVYTDMLERYEKEYQKMFPTPRYDTIEEAKQNIKPGPLLDLELRSIQQHQELMQRRSQSGP